MSCTVNVEALTALDLSFVMLYVPDLPSKKNMRIIIKKVSVDSTLCLKHSFLISSKASRSCVL